MKTMLHFKGCIWIALLFITQSVFAQQLAVKGVITSKTDGQSVIGASVLETGTTNGTVTDMDGNFSLTVKPNSTLTISYIGYKTLVLKPTSSMKIVMEEDNQLIDEVVVTGYMTEKKADITGAVSVVKMDEIASIPTGNIMSSLQGRLPGINIVNDGTPGGVATSTAIRGTTTINDSSPLYVIDGVPTRSNLATLLNANDVESIQILKDAASASIYGTQAANGVIIITTKRAAQDKLTINFDAQLVAQTFHTGIGMLNARQWGEVYWQAYKNDGLKPAHDIYGNGDTPVIPEFIDSKHTIRAADTNWADEVYRTSLMQNYNLTVSKGSKTGSSTFSLNYIDQDGLIKYTNFTRINARINSDYRFLNDRLRVGENVTISNWKEILKPGGIEELTIAQHPIIPVYDINGGYAGPTQGIGDKPNPIRLLDQQKENRSEQWRIFGNMYIEIEPLKNLVFRSNLGVNYRPGFFSNFEPKWSEGDRNVDKNNLYTKSDYDRDWVWSNTLAYNLTLGQHSLSALAGMEAKEYRNEWLDGKRYDYLLEDIDFRYLSAGDGAQTNGGLASKVRMVSYFGKLNYSFQDKYLLSGTVRRDASSRFGRNNNAGVFPAVSGGWRISQENFMKDVEAVNDLKLRVSWGKNGNDMIDNEATYNKYITDLNKGGYDLNGINQGVIPNGVIKTRTGSSNVKWEVTTQTNVGIDLAMLKNRLLLTLDYYNKDTKDMLIDRPYIAIIGEGGYMAYNGASLNNKGVEASLTWRDHIGKDFNYEVTLNGSFYKNKITDLPEDIYYTWGGGNGINKSIVGQPLGSWMGYKTNGLYRTEEDLNDGIDQPGKGLGRIRYVDLNDDKVIDEKDRTWLGSDRPKFVGGLNIALNYKQFDFSAFFSGMVRDAWNNSRFYTDFFQLWTGNHGTRLLNAWNPQENFNSDIPALTALNLNDEGRGSEYFIENGSYLKMKNIQLGYTLPQAIASKLKMTNFRVYVQGQDLFTWTKYSGADPEGLGYPYPLPRSFTFGLSFGF
ncbi:SusC/RagA family TonB-linked outer membrane protein [Parabacteroides pacaensis]|uniref:SusC/RagA family TonB-linked outer membrane protein n=1 Tax=Parabacteroides pacaensis TaxID=2086575 RepID=UPI000D108B20|nr:TonB-dependent receptor [Parabacteroides pacaensis]